MEAAAAPHSNLSKGTRGYAYMRDGLLLHVLQWAMARLSSWTTSSPVAFFSYFQPILYLGRHILRPHFLPSQTRAEA